MSLNKSGCNRKKVVVFGQKCFYSGKWLYSGKVVVLEQKWFYSGKSGCVRAKEVVFG